MGRGQRKKKAARQAEHVATRETREWEEREQLRRRWVEEAPARGSTVRVEGQQQQQQQAAGGGGDDDGADTFRAMALSRVTLRGLEKGGFTHPTEIQRAALPHSLAGRDILGAARTGSGKTLAFLVPVLERLWAEGWMASSSEEGERGDGLGALIISPTRELAVQIFEVLRVVGCFHSVSAGLLVGGRKEFQQEQRHVPRMNVLVATPGRLLQHLEQTPGFDASNVQMLVLDEADRILDMGFAEQLNSILSYLPPQRQTLLFSATQTKSVKSLARLSLRSPEYLFVSSRRSRTGTAADAAAAAQSSQDTDTAAGEAGTKETGQGAAATAEGGGRGDGGADGLEVPAKLVQSYLVCKLEDKFDVLFSFIKSHLKCKMIVFFSTAAQVRFVFECFRGLQPGVPLMCLHGKIKQEKRTHIYFDFCRKQHACMLATDVAARGLDFPSVDWVVQCDAPEDHAMYVHRVGRTARYQAGGRALMLVLPSEERGLTRSLAEKGIRMKKLHVNPRKHVSVKRRAGAIVASDRDIRRLAVKAFQGYLRAVKLMPDKTVFQLDKIPVDAYAEALGLPQTPSTAFLDDVTEPDRDALRAKKNQNRGLLKLKAQIKLEKLKKRLRRKESDGSADEDALRLLHRQVQALEYFGPTALLKPLDDLVDERGNTTRRFVADRESQNSSAGFLEQAEEEEDEDEEDDEGDEEDEGEEEDENEDEDKDEDEDEDEEDGDDDEEQEEEEEEGSEVRSESESEGEDSDGEAVLGRKRKLRSEEPRAKAEKRPRDAKELERAMTEKVKQMQDRLRSHEEEDRERYRERVREQHRERRLRDKGLRGVDGDDDGEGGPVVLLGASDRDNDVEDDDSGSRDSNSDSDDRSEDDEEEGEVDDDDEEEEDIAALQARALRMFG